MNKLNTTTQPKHDIESMSSSLESLQETATSIQDILEWFEANPKAILGNVTFPEDAVIEFELSIDRKNILPEVVHNGCIRLETKTFVTYQLKSPFPLETDFFNEVQQSVIRFSLDTHSDLTMTYWPLVTAHAAEEYMQLDAVDKELGLYKSFAMTLNHYLQEQFPGWTLEKLNDLVDAGLLHNAEGEFETGTIRSLLFEARTTRNDAAIPYDLVP